MRLVPDFSLPTFLESVQVKRIRRQLISHNAQQQRKRLEPSSQCSTHKVVTCTLT